MSGNRDIEFSNLDRQSRLSKFIDTEFDLIVVGGGITGCGIVLDASLRGLKTLLLEKKDYASGTSSKSTKLIHGGLRYLKQLEFGLVRETGTERAVAHANIPHLVHPESMLLPIVKGGTFSSLSANIAISVYDGLAGVKPKDRKKNLNYSKTLNLVPQLNKEILKSGIKYSEYRTDDARLCIELVKAARRNGAESFNYMEVIGFETAAGKINQVNCHDLISGTDVKLKTRHVINASGPWADKVRSFGETKKQQALHLTKGVHIVVNKSDFPLQMATYFDAFDGRMIFAIPREQIVYIGTSDTTFKKDKEKVFCSAEDADYLLDATNKMFPSLNLTKDKIRSSWAGLRPLIQKEGKGPTELSRKDEIFVSDVGLITIAGGKLTGFRKMAERSVDMVCKREAQFAGRECKTKEYKIHADSFNDYESYQTWADEIIKAHAYIDPNTIWYLINNYGKHAKGIIEKAIFEKDKSLDESILLNELLYTIHFESVSSTLDFFERRTGMLYFNIERVKSGLELVLNELAKQFHWDAAHIERERSKTQEVIDMVSLKHLRKSN